MYLKNLLYLFEINRTIPLLDDDGEQVGELPVQMYVIFPASIRFSFLFLPLLLPS